MKNRVFYLPLIYILVFFLAACNEHEKADLILLNGNVITLDENLPTAEAIAISGNRIVFTGTTKDAGKWRGRATEVIDLAGKTVIPGFIEGHGHFMGMGFRNLRVNLLETENYQEVIDKVSDRMKTTPEGHWIEGRGWHQEKWNLPLKVAVDGFPHHRELSERTPDHPVILTHASGHTLLANERAMELAGIDKHTPDPAGGRIIRDKEGHAIGIFEQNAMQLIRKAYAEFRENLNEKDLHNEWVMAFESAQDEAISKGITTFHDAGVNWHQAEKFMLMADRNELKLRLYIMINENLETLKANVERFPVIDHARGMVTINSIKQSVDGALGSRGAWLLEEYTDAPGHHGHNTTALEDLLAVADFAAKNNIQLSVHAIGDRANREVIRIFEQTFARYPGKDFRWRIEHAQHLHPDDIPFFGKLGIIASMQGVHCTSDAIFVPARLGKERSRTGAYAWRSLLDHGAVIANGTDAPVEDVCPIASFYASVTRQTAGGDAFYPEQSMTRMEALKSYTINNAFAAFQENEKGTVSVGKLADLVVLSQDITTVPDNQIPDTEVVYTIIDGKVVWQR